MELSLCDGNEALAWAAYEAGCRFFASYPITPATSIFNHMLNILPAAGGIVLQAEDEIAAMGYCIGASMAGLKAMTATSGPGLSLFSEHISFAIGSEIPLVIVDVQRLGPSTGSATKGADGDIEFMRWGSSGGLPVIVLAPVDASDCFTLTLRAFNLSEEYRCPVFVASNKEVAQTIENIDWNHLDRPSAVDRTPPQLGSSASLPFEPLPDREVPGFIAIGDRRLARQTSSTHGLDGYITTDPKTISEVNLRMQRKLLNAVDKFSYAEVFIEPQADTMLLTYGVTARAAQAACKECKAEGKPVSLLILKTLWPVPESLILQKSADAKRIVVIEMNLGQYVTEIRRLLRDKKVDFFGQMNGELITPAQIKNEIYG